jgi:hypothetical protein
MAAATVHKLKPKPSIAKLRCTACGALADAACNCGAPYEPAGKLAERAIAANPDKSDRAIAKELGVNNATVSRARNRAGVANATSDRHVGQDGKSYPAKGKRKEAKPDECELPTISRRMGSVDANSWISYLLECHVGFCNAARNWFEKNDMPPEEFKAVCYNIDTVSNDLTKLRQELEQLQEDVRKVTHD